MKGEIAENIGNYARRGSIAAFCSGAYAVIKQFSYTYPNGVTECYDGYVPLIDAMARGPEDSGFRDREEGVRFDDVRILPVFSHVAAGPKQLDLCYANGPSFDPQGLQGRDDIRILSSFLSGKISILAKQMPEGGVVVCFGSLPEIQSAHIPAHSSEAMTLMKNKMEVAEAGRRELWDISMKILESRSLYPA